MSADCSKWRARRMWISASRSWACTQTLSEHGLLPTLTQYLAKYEKNYGIQTQLEGSDTFTDGAFEPLVEVQLLRILQEALTNVRKHANARSVRIAFVLEDGWARVTVHDDGQGFDPDVSSAGMEGACRSARDA